MTDQSQQQIKKRSLIVYRNLIDAPTFKDLLKFEPTAQALAKDIMEMIGAEPPSDDNGQRHGSSTIGVYGEWGSGKTSFLQMVGENIKKLYLQEKIEQEIRKQAQGQPLNEDDVRKQASEKIDQLSKNEREKLQEEVGIRPIRFDAWKYDKEDNLWAALLQTILNKVGEQSTWDRRAKAKLRIWWNNLRFREGSWGVLKQLLLFVLRLVLIVVSIYALFSLYPLITGNSLTTLIQKDQIPSGLAPLNVVIAIFILALAADPFKLVDFLKGEISIDFSKFENKPNFVEHIAFMDTFTEEFQQIVRLLDQKPLVVIIDDLDRCLPEKAIQVLEAIKVFLDFDRCVFLLALDRKMVERYVAFKYKDMMGIDSRWFRFIQRDVLFYEDYLDKIIQMSIAVPRMAEDDIKDFIAKLNGNDEDTDITDCASIFSALPPNPRKIKRALKTFLFVRDLIEEKDKGKVNLPVLVKLILLYYQYPYLYERLTEKPELLEQLEGYYKQEMQPDAAAAIVQRNVELAKILEEADKHQGFKKIFLARKTKQEEINFAGIPLGILQIYFTYIDRVPKVASPPPPPSSATPPAPPVPSAPSKIAEPASTPVVPPVWEMPIHQNSFFIGRENLLKTLHENFTQAKKQRQAISGLGGVGKTAIAVEYAYRYRGEYNYVLWMSAVDSDTLTSDFLTAANSLRIPLDNNQSQERIITDVKQWLNDHPGWLLILDNVEDFTLLNKFLPTADSGHILLTTRAQAVDPNFSLLPIKKMDKAEGTLLLLRRARLLASNALLEEASEQDKAQAEQIVEAMDGLPLALDQAAAYIEGTKRTLQDYYQLYQQHSKELLERRSSLSVDHPEPFATTCLLSFEKVKQDNQAAADLLRLVAFLAPDDIPEQLITGGSSYLKEPLLSIAINPLEFDKTIEALGRYSLISREPTKKTISIHRLVQAVIKDQMNAKEQLTWAKQVILAVNHAFPEEIQKATWKICDQYLPHALACEGIMTQHKLTLPEAAALLYRTGAYEFDRFQSPQAEDLYKEALAIQEKVEGDEHINAARTLNALGLLYVAQGRYSEAESLYVRALGIRRKAFGDTHLEVAQSLYNLAALYYSQGSYEEAEELYKQVVDIRIKQLGNEHVDVADAYIRWGDNCRALKKYTLAQEYYVTALEILENTVGPEHISLATARNNLAALYEEQGLYDEAEKLYKDILAFYEKAARLDYPNIVSALSNLALFYQKQNKYDEALSWYQHAQDIYEQDQESDHLYWITILNNRGLLYKEQRQADKAEADFQAAVALYKRAGQAPPELAATLDNLAELYDEQGRDAEAEANYLGALAILESDEQVRKSHYLLLTKILENYAALLWKTDRPAEAEKQVIRSKEVQELYGPKKPAS